MRVIVGSCHRGCNCASQTKKVCSASIQSARQRNPPGRGRSQYMRPFQIFVNVFAELPRHEAYLHPDMLREIHRERPCPAEMRQRRPGAPNAIAYEFHECFYSRPVRTDAGMLGLKNVNIFLPRSFSEAPMCQTSAPSVSADCNLLKDSASGIRKESLPRSSPQRVSGIRAADCKSARQVHFLARMPRRLFKSPPHWARSGKIGISGGGSVGQGNRYN